MNFSESSGITLCLQMVICFIYPIRSRCLDFFSLCSCCLVHGKKTFLQQRSQESTLGLAAERISQEICDEEQCCPILGVVFTRCKFLYLTVIFHFLSIRFLSDCSIKTAILGWARAIRVLFSQSWWVWSLLFWSFVSCNFVHIQTCSFSTFFHFSQVLRRNRTFPCWNANCDKYLQQRNSAVNPQLLQAI